jgi:hypothetical protein
MFPLEFFIDIILPAALCPWSRLSLGVKGGRCVGLTNLPTSCADYLEIWEPQTPGTVSPCPGLYRYCFTLYYFLYSWPRHVRGFS